MGRDWLTVAVGLCLAAPAPAAAQAACTHATAWSPATAIGPPAVPMLYGPRAGATDDRAVLTGQLLPGLLSERPVPEPTLLVQDLGGHDLGRPPGAFTFGHPRIALGEDGQVHLVWGEPAEEHRPRSGHEWVSIGQAERAFRTLWHAAYRPDRGWGAPTIAYEGRGLHWKEASDLVVDAAGRLHLAVGERPLAGPPPSASPGLPPPGLAIIHLVLDRGQWSATVIPGRRGAYVSLAVAPDDGLLLAHISAAGPEDPNSVFVTQSGDGGRTWGASTLVYASGGRRAYEVRTAVTHGRLHLLWAQHLFGPPGVDVVTHVWSGDGGATWSGRQFIDAPEGFGELAVVTDACDQVHIALQVVEIRSGVRKVVLWHGRWAAGRWVTSLASIPTETSAMNATLVRRGDQVALVYSRAVEGGSDPPLFERALRTWSAGRPLRDQP